MAEAAKAAGLQRQNLWKMLNGKERISVETCFRFCQAWDMSLSEVIKLFYPEHAETYKRYLQPEAEEIHFSGTIVFQK